MQRGGMLAREGYFPARCYICRKKRRENRSIRKAQQPAVHQAPVTLPQQQNTTNSLHTGGAHQIAAFLQSWNLISAPSILFSGTEQQWLLPLLLGKPYPCWNIKNGSMAFRVCEGSVPTSSPALAQGHVLHSAKCNSHWWSDYCKMQWWSHSHGSLLKAGECLFPFLSAALPTLRCWKAC